MTVSPQPPRRADGADAAPPVAPAASAGPAAHADPAASGGTGPRGSGGAGSGTPSAPASAPLSVSVNGGSREVPYGTTLDQLVAELTSAPSGVAAAVNETVVPRGEWPRTRLADGDRVEVLTAVQGG